MKQKLLFIFALLCAVVQGVQAKNTVYNLSTLAWSGETMILVAEDGDELTGSIRIDKDHRIKWEIAEGASITLNNVKIEGTLDYIYVYWDDTQFVSDFAGITCKGDATITLVGENFVKGGGPYNPGIQPGPEGTTLTIKGTGSLYADCCGCGPGIGSKAFYEKCGNISIEGGTITAIGGTDGQQGSAGIGAGYETSCGDITFKNCTVEARGGYHSAGIGKSSKYNSPSNTQCGVISIEEGANITAYGGEKAAGIGGGSEFPGCETRIYAGSVVKAYGGKYGAGIGGGYDAGGGPLWISGGYVEAHGGTDAAGIGGGETGNSGDIVINGGEIYAYGNGYGVGIGAGEDGDVAADRSSISINGGFIHAEGGEDIGRAIGGEDDEDYNVNVLSFGPGMYAYVPLGSPFPDVPLYYFERNTNLMNSRVVEIKPCEHSGQTLSYARVDDYKHRFYCKWCGFMEESHTGEFSCTRCNYAGTPQTVHYYEMVYNEQNQKYEYQMVATETFKNGLILPSHKGTVPTDRVFVGWVGGAPDAEDDGILKETSYYLYSPGSYLQTDNTVAYFKARYVNKTLDLATVQSDQKVYDGVTVTGTLDVANYPVKITIANGATVTLSDANISGIDNSNYSWAGITCEGHATIILADGTTNTVKGFYHDYPGIYVPQNYTLTIKGETAGTGSLNASSNGFGAGIGGGYYGASCGVINIQGGNITATGGKYCAGIGSSHRNSCSHIIISGGTIHATGGEHAAGIGSGWGGTNQGDFSSCGMISITNGVTSVTATKSDAPNSIGAGTGNSTCGSVSIGSKLGAVTRDTYIYLPLANASSNSTKVSGFATKACDVTLKDRTLYRDGAWNTLCLPFEVTLEGSPLAGAEARTLSSANLSDGTLTLNFSEPVTTLTAGTPYIIKWDEGAADFVIRSESDWNTFAQNVYNGNTYSGKIVWLAADITVSQMVGPDVQHSFKGTFNGNGHTLNFQYNTAIQYNAPFRCVEDATISNLHTTGTGNASDKFYSGLVAVARGTNVINNCWSSVVINSSVSGDGTHGGLVAYTEENNSNTTLNNCLFDGSIIGSNTHSCGGLIGWNYGTATLTNCVFRPTSIELASSNNATFSRGSNVTVNNCYYSEILPGASEQGTAIGTMSNDDLVAALGDGWQIKDSKVIPAPMRYIYSSIENPTFTNVTITATTPNDITPNDSGSDGSVTFKGTFDPVTIGTGGDNTKLYLGSDNKLYWPSKAMSINSFRAYFQLNNGITAGELSSPKAVRAFKLNFDGGEQTGITTTNYTNFTNSDDAWYDLSGRKLSGKPTTKGLYINNGKKVVIK